MTASYVIGSERTRAPTASKMALPIAGAMTVTAGSPQPTAGSPLTMMLTSIKPRRRQARRLHPQVHVQDTGRRRDVRAQGEWAESRVLKVQFQHIKDNDVGQFRDISTQIVITPTQYESGEMIYPYEKAK